MGTQWTNKYAILRDLSYAQGRKVPADISKGSVGAGEKPPAPNVEEETEEEYMKSGGDGELHTEPDLFMIKHMLNWVREVDEDDVDDINNENVIQISKPNICHVESDKVLVHTNLNPLCTEFVPRNLGSGDNNATCTSNIEAKPEDLPKSKKKRRERNAAIVSLLEKKQQSFIDNPFLEEKEQLPLAGNSNNATIITENNLNSPKQNKTASKKDVCNKVKLLKPNDFISDQTVTEAVDKVTEWLQGPKDYKSAKINPITVSPSSMFKKKQPKARVLDRRSDASSIKSSDSDTPRIQPSSTFVPSTQANEYYKKYVERSKMQKIIQEGIWEKAERVMKEIEAKRLKDTQDEIAKFLEVSTAALEEETDLAPVEDMQGLLQEGCADSETIDVNVNSSDDVDSEQVDVSKQTVDNSGQHDQDSKETNSTRLKGLDLVRLPKHRHDLPEECKVCVVLAKYKPSE